MAMRLDCTITLHSFRKLADSFYKALLILLTFHSISSAAVASSSNLGTGFSEAPLAFAAISSSHIISDAESLTESAAAVSSLLPAVEGVRIPDWNGVWIDTGLLFGSQFVAAGIIYTMPDSVSGWNSEQRKNSFKKYARNVSDPVFDKDKFYINYVLHPYWGAAYYIRARERGLNKIPSFMYSTLISAMYEFGVECFMEKPSIQDLIVTPIAGSLVGAFLFEPWRESIRQKETMPWYDHVALVVTDPIGVLSNGIEKIVGIRPTINVEYSLPLLQKIYTKSDRASQSTRIGIVMQFPID